VTLTTYYKGNFLVRNIFRHRLIFSGVMAAAIACAALAADVADAGTISGNVAGWLKNATKVGPAADSTAVTIAVHMALTNTAGLKSFVSEISTPGTKEYGRYLTNEEFADHYAPAAADVNTVKALLEHAGMTDVVVGPLGAYVSARATVSQIKSTFNVSQDLYSYKGLTLRANSEAPTLPAALVGKVVFLEGLDDTTLLRKPFHRSAFQGPLVAPAVAAAPPSKNTPPPVADANPSPYCNKDYGPGALVATLSTPADVYGASIPWLNCGYTPQQIQAAYGLNKVAYDGTGITVAILDAYASPTLFLDLYRYSENHGLKKPVLGTSFKEIIPPGIYEASPTAPCGPYGWWNEQSLDVAAVHGAAPGANILFVGSEDCATSLDVALMNVLYGHLADVATNSYGYGGESIAPGQQAADDQALLAGAAQGMTVLFSSGDDGDLSAINGVASGSWPATSAYVTGVGGTSLLIKNSLTGAKAEYGWGTYRDFLADVTVVSATSVIDSGVETTSAYGYTFDAFSFYSGSTGGISLLEAQPAYQAPVVPYYLATTLNLASGYTEPLPNPQRVSPDIAMVADPYTGYLYGETYTIAGNPISDSGCTPISSTEEYCEDDIGGTSLSSPLMAGVFAVVNQARKAAGKPVVGFANPMLYGIGSLGDGTTFNNAPINEIVAPTEPVSVLRGYAANLNEARVVTVNSVPFLITTSPFALEVCGLALCQGIDEVFNYTSLSPESYPPTPAGYNDVTGLGVPWVPQLITGK
jgi:subtilase family serine protease